jgi:hypothetical protein
MLDQIIGENNFRNEIVWKRTGARSDAHRWNAVHDTILFYTRTSDFTWHTQFSAHSEEYLASKYTHDDGDGRKYRLDNITSPNPRPNMMYEWKGHPHPAKGWRYSRETMADLDAEGLIWYPKDKAKRPQLKRYLESMKGVAMGTVWTDIPPLNSQAQERLGYPTQKPLPLMERIVQASSNPNDVILDAFCGCGTALEAAEHLGRQWVGIDVSPTACQVIAKRMRDKCHLKENEAMRQMGRGYALRDLPWSEDKLRKIPPFEFENWAVIRLNGIPNKAKVGDMGIDGRVFPLSAIPASAVEKGELDFMDKWFPIQVKQKDKAGRIDIDNFEAVMHRTEKAKGYFVSFDFTSDALLEIRRFHQQTGKVIKPLRVTDMLDDDQLVYQLA